MELTVHLFKQGLIDAETAMTVLSARVDRRTPIGRLAVERGLLTVKEVMAVLTQQADEPGGLRFGEMAVSMGLLSMEELQWLLREQHRAVPSELELAIELSNLSREAVMDALGARRAKRLSAA
jgi:hypothetical protein